MLRKVHLYDHLKDQFGGPHLFDIGTPAEAFRALAANFPQTFAPAFRNGNYAIVAGASIDDGEQVPLELLGRFTYGADDIHILPVAEGAKSGTGKAIATTILGVALIGIGVAGAAGVFGAVAESSGSVLGLNFGAEIGFAGITYGNVALFGASLLLSGVAGLLTNLTDPSKVGPTTASYLLNGPTNTADQGGAVPLVFGRFRVGSTIVSTSLHAKDITVGSQNFTTDVIDAKGNTISPHTPPDLFQVGMVAPGLPDIEPYIAWMYPYPAWPGSGTVPTES